MESQSPRVEKGLREGSGACEGRGNADCGAYSEEMHGGSQYSKKDVHNVDEESQLDSTSPLLTTRCNEDRRPWLQWKSSTPPSVVFVTLATALAALILYVYVLPGPAMDQAGNLLLDFPREVTGEAVQKIKEQDGKTGGTGNSDHDGEVGSQLEVRGSREDTTEREVPDQSGKFLTAVNGTGGEPAVEKDSNVDAQVENNEQSGIESSLSSLNIEARSNQPETGKRDEGKAVKQSLDQNAGEQVEKLQGAGGPLKTHAPVEEDNQESMDLGNNMMSSVSIPAPAPGLDMDPPVSPTASADSFLSKEQNGESFASNQDSDLPASNSTSGAGGSIRPPFTAPSQRPPLESKLSPAPLPSQQPFQAKPGLPQWIQEHFLDSPEEAAKREPLSDKCDLWTGRWVYEESYPLWDWKTCPFGNDSFNCALHGRSDLNYLKLRWQPDACNIPRFNALDFLDRMRNKRMIFVGDSLGRNQFTSLLCMTAAGVERSRISTPYGDHITNWQMTVQFIFLDYNFTLGYSRSVYLLRSARTPAGLPKDVKAVLLLDEPDPIWDKRADTADVVVFNAGHWLNRGKLSDIGIYVLRNDTVVKNYTEEDLFRSAMRTVSRWVEDLKSPGPAVYFRGFAPSHYRFGAWNSGGRCTELIPNWNETATEIAPQDRYYTPVSEKFIAATKHPLRFLDVLKLSTMRRDAHIGRMPTKKGYDCSHWCVPGVPDTWNELFYAKMLAENVI